ncbi:MAG: hypothetical protein R3F35_21325 [Myxococcota bacterium]
MAPATGLILQHVRCNAADRSEPWLAWLDETWLPALRALPGLRAATLFALRVQPALWMPSVGFTHVVVIETTVDVEAALARVRSCEAELRAAGRVEVGHCLIGEEALRTHGRHAAKPLPGPDLRGHILAWVLCNDPRVEAEWDAWNDAVHMPDMLASGAFTGVSRWVRAPKGERGTQHVTLYDVGEEGVDVAVEKSAAVMPGLVASGRKHAAHAGGLTLMLVRAGREVA